jgi:uncharacterized protein YggU (UPF0235/DUF167 family)
LDPSGLELQARDGGCRLRVKVKPAAKQDMFTGVQAGALRMTVVAPPERGKANAAVARILAGALNVATSRVSVVSGFTSQLKIVWIEGCSPDDVRRRFLAMPRVSTGAGQARRP